MEHVFYRGADGFAELVAKQRAGYGWLDASTWTFLRERPRRATPVRRTAARDYLADWRL